MDITVAIKTVIGVACSASLIAMAFLSMTPAVWFLTFCSIPIAWLFGEGIVKAGVKLVRGKPLDSNDK